MKLHKLVQGSPEWLAYRAQHFNASDAPAMMGCSPYKTRAELLREMHTGVAPDVDANTQRLFDSGHRFEELARPLGEALLDDTLYPLVGSEGKYSASFDGLTIDYGTAFEHKRLNSDLRAAFVAMDLGEPGDDAAAGRLLPLYHRVQMEQQLLVSGAERCLFMASEWNAEGELVEERHCWYYPDASLRQQIVDAWQQFDKDLAAYELPKTSDNIEVVGRRPDQLPALRSTVRGELVLESNIKEWEAAALAYIQSVRDHELKTDEDFANADEAAKWCDTSKQALQGVRANLMGATGDVNTAVATLDRITVELDKTRIAFTNAIKARKESRKEELVLAARAALDKHIAALHAELAPMRLQAVAVDFAAAIKGLRSFASMQDALDTALANGKIAADTAARGVRTNLAVFKERAAGFEFLFTDLGQIVHKAADDFATLVTARVDTHKVAEERQREAERARIQAEEAEKARVAEAERARKAQAEEDALVGSIWSNARRIEADGSAYIQKAARAFETAASDWQDDPRPRVREAVAAARAELATKLAAAQQRETAETATRTQVAPPAAAAPVAVPAPPPAPAVVALPVSRSRADEPATLNLGAICSRLGFTVNAAFITDTLGVKPAATERGLPRFRESQFAAICAALVEHIGRVQELQAA